MDPISALSLAANIFAVVDFSVKIVNLVSEIHTTGDSTHLKQVEESTEALKAVTQRIVAQNKVSTDPDPDDAELVRLAEESIAIGDEISHLINRVRACGIDRQPWYAVRTAFNTIWNRRAIDELDSKLSRVRQSLNLQALLSVKTKLDKACIRFDEALVALDDRTRDFIPILLEAYNNLGAQNDTLLRQQEHSELLAQTRHEEVIDLLNRVQMPVETTPNPGGQISNGEKIEQVKRHMVLSLWFPSMKDREEITHEAYSETYKWVFGDTEASEKPWDNMAIFLRQGSGTYWVSGKAGSGKSTLMKYITTHDTTTALLQTWAGDRKLMTATFYFYYQGSGLQKSQTGVLRSLLYQLLDKDNSLIEAAFPERYRSLMSARKLDPFEPSALELKRAFTRLVETCSDKYFFFAIDGLDEYEAGQQDMSLLVQTFRTLAKRQNIKALLSSRPWVVFEESFEGCPRLRLHELTHPDIQRFVFHKIGLHPRARILLESQNNRAIQKLMEEIVEASSGVFLWVSLVVHSLLDGLSNHETVEDLRERLLEFPVDIEDLYRYIWKRIPSRYRREASECLQLVEASTLDGGQISLMGFSFAQENEKRFVFDAGIRSLTTKEVSERLETMEARLLSRCMGLIEVSRTDLSDSHDPLYLTSDDMYFNRAEAAHRFPFVVYIHRTVYDFMSSPEVRQELIAATSGPATRSRRISLAMSNRQSETQYCPSKALFRASLLRIKTFAPPDYFTEERKNEEFPLRLETLVQRCLYFAREIETSHGRAETGLLAELDRVMTHHGRTFASLRAHWAEALYHQIVVDRTNQPCWVHIAPKHNFLSLAVQFGLVYYVRDCLADCLTGTTSIASSRKASLSHHKTGRPILDYSLLPDISSARTKVSHSLLVSLAVFPEMVELLIRAGADPNELRCPGGYSNDTVWTRFLHMGLNARISQFRCLPDVPRVIKALLLAGASVAGFKMHGGEAVDCWGARDQWTTPYAICRHIFHKPPSLIGRAKPSAGDREQFSAGMIEVLQIIVDRMTFEQGLVGSDRSTVDGGLGAIKEEEGGIVSSEKDDTGQPHQALQLQGNESHQTGETSKEGETQKKKQSWRHFWPRIT